MFWRAVLRSPIVPWATFLLAGPAMATGCLGQVGAPSGTANPLQGGEKPPLPSGDGGSPGATVPQGTTGEHPPSASCPGAPATSLRRLTAFEYQNTVRDLLADHSRPGDAFEPENAVLGFDNNPSALVQSEAVATQYESAADSLSRTAVAHLPELLGCDPSKTPEDACVRAFILAFGRRAFRTPLPDSEVDDYLAFYKAQRPVESVSGSVQMLLAAMLQAPAFLYRFEITPAYALASRLSYLLWGTLPDAALWDAADNGRLRTPDDVAREARRMMSDRRVEDVLLHFHAQWLQLGDEVSGVEKDPNRYPGFAKIAPLLIQETRQFLGAVVLDGDGRLETLFSADFSYMNKALADFYGAKGPQGTGFERIALDGTRRSGLLTQGSVMAAHATMSDTVIPRRGKFVLEQMLCQTVLPPPPDVPPLPPASEQMPQSQRARLEVHTMPPACAGCHQTINPPGFLFEHYGAAGEWRDSDEGAPIDTATELRGTIDLNGPLADAVALAHKLARSDTVQSCLTTQWFRYAYGRGETSNDQCTLTQLKAALTASNGNMRDLLLGLTQTDSFLKGGISP